MILLRTNKPVPIHGSLSPFHRKMCSPLLVRCHYPPIGPHALPLYLTYISIVPHKIPYVPCAKFHVHIPSLRSFFQRIRLSPRLTWIFRNKSILYDELLLGPSPGPDLEDHPFPFVRGSLFNIFSANLQCWRPSLPSANRGRAMVW
jgi:hypothetical protein